MKAIRTLLLVSVFAGSFSLAEAQDYTAAVRAAAQANVKALLEADHETLANFTYPGLLEMMGGRDVMIEATVAMMEQMEEEGVSLDSATLGDPSKVVEAGEELHVIVPLAIYMSSPEMWFSSKGYLIGSSNDGGEKWTFLQGGMVEPTMLTAIFPVWNEELELPEPEQPEVHYREGMEPEDSAYRGGDGEEDYFKEDI